MTDSELFGVPQPGDVVAGWRVVSELGRGGMASVHEVERDGARRALKLLLPSISGEVDRRRFLREYGALARLSHPNIVRVFEGVEWNEQPGFLMELLEGHDLRGEVDSWQQLPPFERYRRADDIVIQLAGALEYIHALGMVHRDVTPGNIFVLSDGGVRLMDFGVVKEPGIEQTSVGTVVGTVAYIAPEQIEGDAVDARADLYSLGGAYYLMLTGRRPFNARTVAGYIQKHLKRAVRPPHELAPTVPRKADEACCRLLAKDPEDRYASATHLLRVLEDARGDEVALHPHMHTPRLVGRTAELARIREVLACVACGPSTEQKDMPGGLLLITGADGTGRTRVAEEASKLARGMGLPVSSTRNRAPDQRAFAGFRSTWLDLQAEATEPLPAALVGTFDVDADGVPEPERLVVLESMKELLARSGPRVIKLIDPGRADRGTLEMLEYLLRNLVLRRRLPILFILVRGDDTPPPALARILSGETTEVPAEVIEVGAIGVSAVEEMLLDVVHDTPVLRPLAERLQAEGEGNAWLVGDMIRGLVASGRIELGPDQTRGVLRLTAQELPQFVLPVPIPVRDAIHGWLEPLDAPSRRVATVLAIARQDLGLDMLVASSELPEEQVVDALDDLIDGRLVRERQVGGSEHFELARNRLQDVLVGRLTDDERARLHRRFGDVLERAFRRRSGPVVESLAYHFEQGGVPAKAYPYLVQAAEKLLTRTFVSEALDYLDRALVMEPSARQSMTLDEADRRLAQLKLVRSTVLFHLGRWAEADVEARAADALAVELRDQRLQSRTAAELACQARRVRHLDEAEGYLERAMAHARQVGDTQLEIVPLYESGAVRWSRGDLESARKNFLQALALSENQDDERSLALGYNGLGLISLCRGQSAEARRHFERSIEVCERFGLMERLTVARTNLVEVYHLLGNIKKGLALADRAVSHAQEVRHAYGIALGLRYRVMMLTDMGRLVDAIANAEEALRIQRSLDNPEETLATLVGLIRVVLEQQRWGRAGMLLDEAEPLLAEYDSEGFAPVVLAWRGLLWARNGGIEQARAALQAAEEHPAHLWPFQQVRKQVNIARAYVQLGERAPALRYAEEALRVADACGYRYYAMRARQIAARVSPDPEQAARHRRVAEALARSLAANLSREDARTFMALEGVVQRSALVAAQLGPDGGR